MSEIPQKCPPSAPSRSVYDKVYDMAERFAATRIGQMVIARGDGFLRIVEDTAKWSLPTDHEDYKLERPLPWIPFLFLIIALRLVRIYLSIAAVMIGNEPVMSEDVVHFLHTRRRKLQAIRTQGAKVIKRRERVSAVKGEAMSGTASSLMSKLKELLSKAICRPGGQHRHESVKRIFVHSSNVHVAEISVDRQSSKRAREDENCDENLSAAEMLEKYANLNSDEDSDFVPYEDTCEDSNTSSVTATSSSEHDTLEEEDNAHDTSIEIHENGDGHEAMPQPIIMKIKEEPSSVMASGDEQLLTSSALNGGGREEESMAAAMASPDVVVNLKPSPASSVIPKTQQLVAPVLAQDDSKKATPGHESAAKASIMAHLSSTALAGSPMDFNELYRNASMVPADDDAYSIPKACEVPLLTNGSAKNGEGDPDTEAAKHKKYFANNKSHQHQQQRFRGRNRR